MAEIYLGLRGLEESMSMPTTEATKKDEEEGTQDRTTIVEAEASSVSSELLLTSDSNNKEDETTQVTITNTAGDDTTNQEGDVNHPCNSNDGAQWNLLTQAMFGDEGGGINPETGELINSDIFIVDNKPCPNPLEGVGEEEEEEGVDEEEEEVDEGGEETQATDGPTSGTASSSTPNPTVEDSVDAVTETTEESGENNNDNAESGDESSSSAKSYYSCSTSTVSTSNSSDDATKLTISYDYELHTTSPLTNGALSGFENTMTQNLADKYGLITCEERKKNLRGLQSSDEEDGGVLLALASDPVDEAKNYECEVQVDLTTKSTCTPVRGYMTAWLPNSNKSDAANIEAEILSYIENGMMSDTYISDDVVKVSYVGEADDEEEDESVTQDTTQDGTIDSEGNDTQQGDGNTVITWGGTDNSSNSSGSDVGTVPTGSSDPTTTDKNSEELSEAVDSSAGLEPNGSSRTSSSNASLEANNKNDDGPPLLAIGLSLFFIAFALALILGVYIRRKRRNKRFFSDGPNDMNNNNNTSLAAQVALEVDTAKPADPDDVQLLPSPDKLDMRSVYSSEDGETTDVETENYTYDKEATSKYGNLYGGYYGDGGAGINQSLTSAATEDYSDMNNNAARATNTTSGSKMSGLAAMGVASTLVTTLSNGPSGSMEEEEEDTLDPTSPASQISGSDHSSHVGTVDAAITPGQSQDSGDIESASSLEEQPTTESMDGLDTFDSGAAWA